MKVERIDKSNKENMEQFDFLDGEILLGSGYINGNLTSNNIYVYVVPQYRSNGYGTQITEYLMDLLKQMSKESITLTIEIDNVHANNMLLKCGAVHLSSFDGYVKYVLPINK